MMPAVEVTIPTLETERLLLRPVREADVEPLYAMMQDPDVMQYIGERRIPTLQEVWRWVAGWIGHWAWRGYGQWAVEERSSGELIGRVGILNPVEWPGPEVAYMLGKPWWGRGYATEAAGAAMDWGFETTGFDRLISLIDPANVASIAVATHLGETPRGEVELWGNQVLIYAIDRAAWEARRADRG
jgi:RimJ/RimL family protein N-acetyltransferase